MAVARATLSVSGYSGPGCPPPAGRSTCWPQATQPEWLLPGSYEFDLGCQESEPGLMAANTSQRQLRASIIALPVAALAGAVLVVDCGSCGWRALPLAGQPGDMTVDALLMRLRCQGCGRGVAAAVLDNGMQGWRRQVVRVWGPGSFG